MSVAATMLMTGAAWADSAARTGDAARSQRQVRDRAIQAGQARTTPPDAGAGTGVYADEDPAEIGGAAEVDGGPDPARGLDRIARRRYERALGEIRPRAPGLVDRSGSAQAPGRRQRAAQHPRNGSRTRRPAPADAGSSEAARHPAKVPDRRRAAPERAHRSKAGRQPDRRRDTYAAAANRRHGSALRHHAYLNRLGSSRGAIAARAALRWLGTPYSWGGGDTSGPTRGIGRGAHTVGFDCSGLVKYAWAKAGVLLAHYATTQYRSGPHPSKGELRPGDLVFFAHRPSNPNTIHHVGIYLGRGDMVEAPFTGSHVRISKAFRRDYAGATRPAEDAAAAARSAR